MTMVVCRRLDACLVMARALAKECPEYGPPDDIWISELDEMSQGLADESEAAQDKADERHRTGWAEWLDRSFKGGARAMHRYTRIQEAWAPAVTTRRGTVTAAPHDIVESELDALVEHWKAETFAERVEVPDRQAFPRASPDAIRAASLSFSALTSQSLDGIHPRQLSLLSDSALECLAALYEAVEAIGMFPQQIWWMLLPLLGKPKGGYRTILLCAGPVRVWQRLRRPFLTAFGQVPRRDYWAFGSGQGAEDAVWQQSIRAEAGRSRGLHTGGFLWDGKKYYDSFVLSDLRHRAIAAQVHPVVVKVQFNFPGAREC